MAIYGRVSADLSLCPGYKYIMWYLLKDALLRAWSLADDKVVRLTSSLPPVPSLQLNKPDVGAAVAPATAGAAPPPQTPAAADGSKVSPLANAPQEPVKVKFKAGAEDKVALDYAKDRRTSRGLLEVLANYPDAKVRALVAGNPNTPAMALAILAKDSVREVRAQVARNPVTEVLVLEQLAGDRDPTVRAAAAKNSKTPSILTELRPPVNTPSDFGLFGRPWMQGIMETGGTPSVPPLPTRVVPNGSAPGTPPPGTSNLTLNQVKALKGQNFTQVAAAVQTPEDVALFLGTDISYDSSRVGLGQSFAGMSSAEVLALGTGICRDQHALARDLLIAHGYEAEMLSYAALDESHAITAYKDPKTGYWGILEYGTLYQPSQLQAHSAVEALMMVRPTVLAISHYDNQGPYKPSSIDGVIYTPASRLFEEFTAGPKAHAGNSITVGNAGAAITADLSKDQSWQGAAQVVTDARFPYLKGAIMMGVWKTFEDQGIRVGGGASYLPNNYQMVVGTNQRTFFKEAMAFVSTEEVHRNFMALHNIKGSGIDLGVSSRTRFEGIAPFILDGSDKGFDDEGASGLASLKWTPDIAASRLFSLWNDKLVHDTKAYVSYGLGVDAGMMIARYASGGGGAPINQYVTMGVDTMPNNWLLISMLGYMPITNYTNDYASSPLGRLVVSTPYVAIGTTQGTTEGRYDATTGLNLGPVNLGTTMAVDQDRTTGQTGVIGSVQVSGNH